jgi:hypothetical protein
MTDDDELLAELELLGANDVDEELLSRPSAAATATSTTDMTSFPNVPNQKMPTIAASNNSSTGTSKKEAEELALLEAELAGMMS